MKKINEVIRKKKFLEMRLAEMKEKQSKMNQIDLLSGEGNSLGAEIHKMEGSIMTLQWMLS